MTTIDEKAPFASAKEIPKRAAEILRPPTRLQLRRRNGRALLLLETMIAAEQNVTRRSRLFALQDVLLGDIEPMVMHAGTGR